MLRKDGEFYEWKMDSWAEYGFGPDTDHVVSENDDIAGSALRHSNKNQCGLQI